MDATEETAETRVATLEDKARIEELIRKANDGDGAALAELRGLLDLNPWLWKKAGDLQATAERALIRLASGGDTLSSESIRRTVAELRRELGGESAGAVERLLIDRVVSTYLEVTYLEAAAANADGSSARSAARLRRLEGATRRHAAAIKSLVTVRKLLPGGDVGAPLRVVVDRKLG